MPTLYRSSMFLGFWFVGSIAVMSQSPSVQIESAPSEIDTADASENHAARKPADDWPRLLGRNFDGAAATSADTMARIDFTLPPTFVWSIKVGPGYGLGAVADGRYIHFDADDRIEINAAGRPKQRQRTRAFDLKTGKQIWSVTDPLVYRDLFGYEEGSRSSPAVDGDRLFTFGVAGKLSCRSVVDGKEIWSVDTSQNYGVVQNFFGVGSSPMVLGDTVIVMIGGSPPADQQIAPMRLDRVSPAGSALVAFDRRDGKERWHCGDDLASYSSPRTISIGGKTFVLLFARGGLMLIDPASGSVKWRYEHRADILESVNAIVPVVDGDEVFISECYDVGSVLLKVTAESATPIWIDPAGNRRRQSMRSHWATPVLVDGFLYGCSGRNAPDSDLRCIDWNTGEVKWTDDRRTRSSVTSVGDHLIVMEERGETQVIRATPDRFEVVADWPLQSAAGNRPAMTYPCWSAPIVVGDLIILRGDEHVACLKFVSTDPS